MTTWHHLLSLVALSAAFGADDIADRIKSLMDEGLAAEASAPRVALERYRQARELAITAKRTEDRGDATFSVGRLLEALATKLPDTTPRLKEAEALYREVAEGQGTQQQIANGWNNLGVLYWRQNRIPEALQSFARIDFKQAEAAAIPYFHYNYGAAWQSDNKPELAFQQYEEAFNLAPDYKEAAAKAIALAPTAVRASSICQRLIGAGDSTRAETCLRDSLKRFIGIAHPADIRPLAIELLGAAASDKELEKRTVTFINEDLQGAAVLQPTQAMFLGRGPSPVRWGKLSQYQGWESAELAARLLVLAERSASHGDHAQALWRYAVSGQMAPGNLDAATGFVTALNAHPSLRASRGEDNGVGALIGELYPNGSLAADHENPGAARRLHLALGEYLERHTACLVDQGQTNPHLPLFHWLGAKAAEDELRKRNRLLPPSFPLGKRLAGCFRIGNNLTPSTEQRKEWEDQREEWINYQKEGFRSFRPTYTVATLAAYHWRSVYFGGAWVRAGAEAGVSQLLGDPKPWGDGEAGYAKRYAAAVAGRAIRQAIAFGLDSTLKQEPHFARLGPFGLKHRVANVFRQTFVCYNRSGNYTLASWRVGSAYGAALASNAWRPKDYRSVTGALERGSVSLGVDTFSNALKEFLPDVARANRMHWATKVLAVFIQ